MDVAVLVFLSALSFSQESNVIRGKTDSSFFSDFVHRVYNTSDGLPGMTIVSLIQDKKGYIWLGSYDGLVRFDGVEFSVFSRYTDSRYGFNSARTIFSDSHENIWVGHNGEGLTCIRHDGAVIKYEKNDGLADNKIGAICEDREGNIWIGTSMGISCINADGEFFTPPGLSELGMEHVTVARLFVDLDGRVWVSTGSEDCILVFENGTFRKFDGITKIKNPTVRGIYQDRSGAYWFGADPHLAIRIKDGEETVFDIGHEHTNGTAIDSISEDSAGNIWFSTDGGLTVLHDGLFSYYDKLNGAPDNGVNGFLEDSEGNFWISYNRGGVEKLSNGKFRTVRNDAPVNAICGDSFRGIVWIATDNGLRAYNGKDFVDNEITEFCKGARVRHVEVIPDGELLISSYSDTIPQIRVSKDNEITVWTKDDGFSDIKSRVSIKTQNGDYYAGTTLGLNILCHEDGKIITVRKENGLSSNDYIMWLYEDSEGQVWVGTNGGGVYIMKDRKVIRHYSTDEGLSGNVIFKISMIGTHIWIATGTGISMYSKESDSFINFNSSMGLGTDSVFQILVDHTNTAWMTTNKGIFSADFAEMLEVANGYKSSISVKYYGNSDGLITNGVTSVSSGSIDVYGRVWFPLVDGFAIYDPAKSGKNTIPPKVEIQNYVIDNEVHDYHGETIVIPAGAKRLFIKYTALSFISSESIRFSNMLSGFEDKFSMWMPSRVSTYTNLKYGNYEFKVKAENSDGVSGEPKVVQIVKEPYLWELWWFWAACGGAVILLISLAIIHKIRNMRRYQIELEQKVEERTRELKIANEKAENLLLNILPEQIADELTEHPDRTIAKSYPNATVLFTDIVGFTKLSGKMTARNVVAMLNLMVSRFDERAKQMGIEKIKTIGDAYMAATGLTETADKTSAKKMIFFAKGLISDVEKFNAKYKTNIKIRVGINTGELVAGVIGKSKFIYDIWGDTVNVASRMESTGEPMRIHVSENTYMQTAAAFPYGSAIEIEVKGKGLMRTFFL